MADGGANDCRGKSISSQLSSMADGGANDCRGKSILHDDDSFEQTFFSSEEDDMGIEDFEIDDENEFDGFEEAGCCADDPEQVECRLFDVEDNNNVDVVDNTCK